MELFSNTQWDQAQPETEQNGIGMLEMKHYTTIFALKKADMPRDKKAFSLLEYSMVTASIKRNRSCKMGIELIGIKSSF